MCETVLIEVKIPVLQQFFDFRISKNLKISVIKQHIVRCIMQIGGNKAWESQLEDLSLCCNSGVLNDDKTLSDYDVHSGDRLVLV